jgi:hypothetical protein
VQTLMCQEGKQSLTQKYNNREQQCQQTEFKSKSPNKSIFGH